MYFTQEGELVAPPQTLLVPRHPKSAVLGRQPPHSPSNSLSPPPPPQSKTKKSGKVLRVWCLKL
ncbi:hypothetical protein E2320_000057 [Naja naja]|nr:hypothetical protein E2320_000057 [Naja naja]